MTSIPRELNDEIRRQYLWVVEYSNGERLSDYKYDRTYEKFMSDDDAVKMYCKTKDIKADYYLFAWKKLS